MVRRIFALLNKTSLTGSRTNGSMRSPIPEAAHLFSDTYVDEARPLLEANWTGDEIESVLRLRSLSEISDNIGTEGLMRLALIAVLHPTVLLALLDVGVTSSETLFKDGPDRMPHPADT
jgi:hypothetical protein